MSFFLNFNFTIHILYWYTNILYWLYIGFIYAYILALYIDFILALFWLYIGSILAYILALYFLENFQIYWFIINIYVYFMNIYNLYSKVFIKSSFSELFNLMISRKKLWQKRSSLRQMVCPTRRFICRRLKAPAMSGKQPTRSPGFWKQRVVFISTL